MAVKNHNRCRVAARFGNSRFHHGNTAVSRPQIQLNDGGTVPKCAMQKIPWVTRRTLLAGVFLFSLTLSLTFAFAANPLNPSPASRTQTSPRPTQPAATSATSDTRSATAKTAETPRPQFDPALWSGMQWREVGPYRGGRALAIEGVPGEPNTYYFGAVAGGVWKTTDGGTNWKPIFDKQHTTSSIGATANAPIDEVECCLSKIGFQFPPPSVVFQTPPATPPK